jgi:hypothetical protein
MEILQESQLITRKTFLTHVFSTTEEGKAELFNVIQYSILAIIPIIVLNKIVQRFVPEADSDKSSLELVFEIIVQLIIMFCGIIFIHRIITYIPTYSGFKYENLALTNVILAFLVIVFSLQTKLGIKVNIIVDRINELWNGPNMNEKRNKEKNGVRVSQQMISHVPSQADHVDSNMMQQGVFPPAPVVSSRDNSTYDNMMRSTAAAPIIPAGPMAANSVLGGAFGSLF